MAQEYLMNIASVLFFLCYIPEFYANYRNKNANIYNVFEKIILVGGTGFGLGYALTTDSKALVINYGTLFTLDILALSMRGYYAYNNYGRDVRVVFNNDIENNEKTNDIVDGIYNPIQSFTKAIN